MRKGGEWPDWDTPEYGAGSPILPPMRLVYGEIVIQWYSTSNSYTLIVVTLHICYTLFSFPDRC